MNKAKKLLKRILTFRVLVVTLLILNFLVLLSISERIGENIPTVAKGINKVHSSNKNSPTGLYATIYRSSCIDTAQDAADKAQESADTAQEILNILQR